MDPNSTFGLYSWLIPVSFMVIATLLWWLGLKKDNRFLLSLGSISAVIATLFAGANSPLSTQEMGVATETFLIASYVSFTNFVKTNWQSILNVLMAMGLLWLGSLVLSLKRQLKGGAAPATPARSPFTQA